MRKKLAAFILCMAAMLTFSGCSAADSSELYSGSDKALAPWTAAADVINDGYLDILAQANTREAHLERNGRYLYEFKYYLADGSVQDEFYYEDDTRYVADDSWDIFILEDNEAYDYEKEPDRYDRYLFPDNFDSFKDSLTYPSMFKKGEGETIISKEVRDGLIYLETFVPYEDFEENADYYGYSGETVDSLRYEYVIDEATDEILELNGYVVKDGKKTLFIEEKYDPDCEVYVPDKALVDAVFGEDT
ncbi:MAG: hypothetical protein K5985_03545, partial [Lachnospiraceae bacterium]|nr:hypothetical protein [Lachnospiraceae bacterium]